MFLLLAPLLLIFLPWPWNLVGGLASGALGVAEAGYWHRRMRRRRVVTGVENLIGAIGEVTESCAPRAGFASRESSGTLARTGKSGTGHRSV
jgi:hypothetical protein